ncbi:type II DNA topoisomerase [Atractiella rhizophila]|nr:type II DNA topoisomerase [Atractiella rhizophila]
MSDSEDMSDYSLHSDSDEEYGASKAKKKAPAKPKAPAKKATTKKAALKDKDENIEDGDEDQPEASTSSSVKAKPAKPAAAKKGGDEYEKLTQLEHVLKRPDTYIGSIEAHTQPMWVFDDESKKMVYRNITFVPGLFKIVDEILVNAADNKQRDPTMDTIKVEISEEEISVYNNGRGIPIKIHEKEKIYIPELIFGHLLTSSNYNDDEKKVTGGRNGYGAKLANIYSTEFTVQTADKEREKMYTQTWKDNMDKVGKAKIKDTKKGEEFTKITFKPDLKRFGLDEITPDMVALLTRRVYDLAGVCKGVKVHLNGKRIPMKSFKDYCELYVNGKNLITGWAGPTVREINEVERKLDLIHGRFGERWEVAVYLSEGQFQQVSFVNSIATTKGGTHIDHVSSQLVAEIDKIVQKKNKGGAAVKGFQIKNHLWVFVNCLIENPAFDSQTKENMTLGQKKFGSKCELTEDFMKKVVKSGVVENVLDWARHKLDKNLKKTDGKKFGGRLTGIAKLDDANNAGGRHSRECTLILTEGDSAKGLAIAGMSVVGRDNYGVFPLRGKLLNVREASAKQLSENAEIKAIKQIMGLKHGEKYDSVDKLRYGSIMIMTDQDHDGSHIKGLIINFLAHFYPSLLKCKDFLVEFITPIVRATKGKQEKFFFTIPEYEEWKESVNNGKGWTIKYYKGLGTSQAEDAKRYFRAIDKHRIPFKPVTDDDKALIDMAFNKKKADDRKEWLRGFQPGTYMDNTANRISIEDFINKELILFSMADNIRSIPSVVDGLKPGQRKVLFACFKRNLKQEAKVAQLSGYIAQHTAYHHGETNLQGTIVNMAQDFVGSNNINLLYPSGMFGTRHQGGKDAASARYIFTRLCPITRHIFHPADDKVLSYLDDDGESIEPEWYTPVLPMVLVNGSSGIGTGWSSNIPNFNPEDIVANLRRKLNGEEIQPMHPWYLGFKGAIDPAGTDKYKVSGIVNRLDDNTVEITELPIGVWISDYKEGLHAMTESTDKQPALVKSFKDEHTDTAVGFTITLTDKGKEMADKEGLEKMFKLSKSISTSNMVCFDANGKIKKYSSAEEILDAFYDVRLEYYHKRKDFLIDDLNLQYEKLSNQARFILMIVNDELVISKRKKADVVSELRKLEFRPFPKQAKMKVVGNPDDMDNDEDEEETADLHSAGDINDFDYLLGMALHNLTKERVDKLLKERDLKLDELNILRAKTPKDLWIADLDEFSVQYQESLEAWESKQTNSPTKKKGRAGAMKARKKKLDSDDSEDDYKVLFQSRVWANFADCRIAHCQKGGCEAEADDAGRFQEASFKKEKERGPVRQRGWSFQGSQRS